MHISLKDGKKIDIGEVLAWSFLSWLASISLDAAVGGDVVQEPAHAVFILTKKSYSTKPTIILNFSTAASFWLWPTG